MPRANRYFLPGHIWHITHRCHEKAFLLKFARDRRRWIWWLFEARKRFGLCVLNYIVTSNHIHLMVEDRGRGEIARSMQLVAGRVGQEYNQRKTRHGAFWEDRYHATVVDSEGYLARCLTYIDLNMVRAGVVSHPREWRESGYRELQAPPRRYRITDVERLTELLALSSLPRLQQIRAEWAEEGLRFGSSRDSTFSDAIAVGSREFVEKVRAKLGYSALHRDQTHQGDIWMLAERPAAYKADFDPKMERLSAITGA